MGGGGRGRGTEKNLRLFDFSGIVALPGQFMLLLFQGSLEATY